jgi:DNA-binding MarR family transcriptional regulator
LSKQTMTTMARALERAGLVERRPDPGDARATRLFLTERARSFRPVAERVLADLELHAARALPLGVPQVREALQALADL